MSEALLRLDGVSRAFGANTVLDQVTLRVPEGTRHAVIGPNGAGKTTLLHLVAGTLTPTAGRVVFDGHSIGRWPAHRRAQAGIARTWQHPAVADPLTVTENVLIAANGVGRRFDPGAGRKRRQQIVTDVLTAVGLGDDAHTLAGRLPYGHRRRLEIALALARQPRLLLLDEPTAGLTGGEIATLHELIQSLPARMAVLLVDHNVDFVTTIADTVTVLDHGQHVTTGTPDHVRAHPDVRRVYLTDPAPRPAEPSARPEPAETEPVLRVADVRAGYHGAPVIDPVDLDVQPGQVVAVLGRSGAGKTTLMNAIAGLHTASTGRVVLDGVDLSARSARHRRHAGISLVPQGRRLFAALTVTEHLTLAQPARRQRPPHTTTDLWTQFPALAQRQQHLPGQLSGGEQQMLATARALIPRPRVLLLDEPSEGLAPARIDHLAALIRQIANDDIAVLLTEQNIALALRVADQVCVLEQGRIIAHPTGDDVAADPDLLHQHLGLPDAATAPGAAS